MLSRTVCTGSLPISDISDEHLAADHEWEQPNSATEVRWCSRVQERSWVN